MDTKTVRDIAVSALLSVCANSENPASARAQAASALLTLIGDIGAKAVPLKQRELQAVNELTEAEMLAEIANAGLDPEPSKPRRKGRPGRRKVKLRVV